MSLSNSEKLLNSLFYEADVFNIGAKSKNNAGRASEQQPILGILSTDKGNNYPRFIKLRRINDYTGLSLKKNIEHLHGDYPLTKLHFQHIFYHF